MRNCGISWVLIFLETVHLSAESLQNLSMVELYYRSVGGRGRGGSLPHYLYVFLSLRLLFSTRGVFCAYIRIYNIYFSFGFGFCIKEDWCFFPECTMAAWHLSLDNIYIYIESYSIFHSKSFSSVYFNAVHEFWHSILRVCRWCLFKFCL